MSLLFRFMLPGRPKLGEEQVESLIATVNRCHEQALAQDRLILDWWKWITSFLTGGVVFELVRYLLTRR